MNEYKRETLPQLTLLDLESREIEPQLQSIFNKIIAVTDSQIVNQELAIPISEAVTTPQQASAAYLRQLQKYLDKRPSPKHEIKQHAFILGIFALSYVLAALIKEDSGALGMAIAAVLFSFLAVHLSQKYPAPDLLRSSGRSLQNLGSRLFFKKEQAKMLALDWRIVNADQAHKQTQSQQGRGFFSFLSLSYVKNPIEDELHQILNFAIMSLKYKVFHCMGIAGMTLLELIEQQIPVTAECFYKSSGYDAHYFMVLNRSPDADKSDLRTWNDHAYIFDPWYGIFASAGKIKQENYQILLKYPLINPQGKVVTKAIHCDNPPKDCEAYLENYRREMAGCRGHLETPSKR